jgi:phage terminase large subunit-like protein
MRHSSATGGQALMAWAVSNARVEPKGNAIVITKQAQVLPRSIL